MATAARDFESAPGRPAVMVAAGDEAVDGDARATPSLERRGSVASRETLRNRKPSRSNTVTAYHGTPEREANSWHPGAEPGVDTSAKDDQIPAHLTRLKASCDINIIDFSDQKVHRRPCGNADLEDALGLPRTEELPCRWISVNGLSWDVIRLLGNKYHLHRLAIEDVIHTKTRTKVDWYAEHAYIVLTLQKLVRLHRHRGRDDKCTCPRGVDSSDEDEEIDAKFEALGHRRSWRDRLGLGKPKPRNVLPRYMDRDHDGNVDEFVSAHSTLSDDSPVKPIRTLHRYESAQIPEHTAWMERHSALAEDNYAVSVEQVSIFLLSDNSVISFFEHSAEDVERPILERLHSPETMLRRSCDASLLLQAIIDAIVDLAAPVKDAYNKSRKELQIDAMTNPNIRTSRALHIFGEEVDMLQNLFKPIVHLVNSLRDHNSEPPPPARAASPPLPAVDQSNRPTSLSQTRNREGVPSAIRKISDFRRIAMKRAGHATSVTITPLAHTYFGDVLDHCITMIQALEQMDASASNISTLIFNTVGAKTNNFMMILAVVTVFFAPLTFISGYFGMNFAGGSGLAHPFAFFWLVAVPALVAFMVLVFGFMLWDNLRDGLARRLVKARWHQHRRASGRTARPRARPTGAGAGAGGPRARTISRDAK